MKRLILVALGILLGATSALAQRSSTTQQVHERRGTVTTITEVSCETTSTTLLASTATGNTMKLTFCNIGATNFVNICTAATCTAATGKKQLVNTCMEVSAAPRGTSWTCIADTAAVTVEIINEKSE